MVTKLILKLIGLIIPLPCLHQWEYWEEKIKNTSVFGGIGYKSYRRCIGKCKVTQTWLDGEYKTLRIEEKNEE